MPIFVYAHQHTSILFTVQSTSSQFKKKKKGKSLIIEAVGWFGRGREKPKKKKDSDLDWKRKKLYNTLNSQKRKIIKYRLRKKSY